MSQIESLEDICVEFITDNIDLCVRQVSRGPVSILEWIKPYPGFLLIPECAQKIYLELLRKLKNISRFYNLFSAESVYYPATSHSKSILTMTLDKSLQDFHYVRSSLSHKSQWKPLEFEFKRPHWTVRSSGCLDYIRNVFSWGCCLTRPVAPVGFLSINVLNVSKSDCTGTDLGIIVERLPNLQCLDISETNVGCICALMRIRHRLLNLIMYNIPLGDYEDRGRFVSTLVTLRELRVLDVSQNDLPEIVPCENISELRSPDNLTQLVYLDLSGNPFGMDYGDVSMLIESHQKLSFVGLASWNIMSQNNHMVMQLLFLEHPCVTMTGDEGETAILNTFLWNEKRPIFLERALFWVRWYFGHDGFFGPRISLEVIRSMENFPNRSKLIVEGLWCLQLLFFYQQVPEELVGRSILVIMNALETHQECTIVQTICVMLLSKAELQENPAYDCIRCCLALFKLVGEKPVGKTEIQLERSALCLLYRLFRKAPTSTIETIVQNPAHVHRMVRRLISWGWADHNAVLSTDEEGSVFERDTDPEESDHYLLVAVEIMTDQLNEGCLWFTRAGGVNMAIEKLESLMDCDHPKIDAMIIKWSNILYNVAALESSRGYLLVPGLLVIIKKMMRHSHKTIQFQSAGILANLCCIEDSDWQSVLGESKESYILDLGSCMSGLELPPSPDINIYFKSFEPLERIILHSEPILEVHLWIFWVIYMAICSFESHYVEKLHTCSQLVAFVRELSGSDISTFYSQAGPASCSTDKVTHPHWPICVDQLRSLIDKIVVVLNRAPPPSD